MTNKTNIDKRYVDLLTSEWRPLEDPNRYSVTKLLGNIRENVILERYAPSDEDVRDSFPAFIGTCVHFYLENHIPDGVNEFKVCVPFKDKYTIVGVIDRLEESKIIDYKVKKMSDEDYDNAMKQIKIYAYLVRQMGIFIDKGEVHAIRKDWSKVKYPDKSPIDIIEFDIDSSDIKWAEEFIDEKIKEYEKARIELPECSDEEKWKSPDSWAAYSHEGDSRAKKVFKTKEEAEEFSGGKMHIEHRIGQCMKCDNFCKIAKICKYYQKQDLE